MSHAVFVSYASQDRAVADAACAALEASGIRCWMAPRDVTPGEDYPSALVSAINESKALVLILSSHSNGSSQVARELERAGSHSIPILPFRIDDVAPSPSVEFFISRTHWLDALTPPLEKHLEQLVGTVGALISPAERAESASSAGMRPDTRAILEPRIQYAKTSDGVNIAYADVGAGPLLIVMPPLGLAHAELNWRMFANVLQPLASNFRTVWYDARGAGLSDRDAIDFSTEAMIRDLEAVVARMSIDSFVLAAWISAVPIAVTYATAHPERVSHLVLCDGWASFSYFSETPAYQAFVQLRDMDWKILTETFAEVLWAPENPAFGRLLAEFMRACVEPEALRAAYDALEAYDVTALLPRIAAPTLVIYNRDSRWGHHRVGQRIAAAIPNARLALIDDITYGPVPKLIEQFVFGEDTAAHPAVHRHRQADGG